MVLTLYMVVLVVFRAQTICFYMWNFQHRQPEADMFYYPDTNQTIIIFTSLTQVILNMELLTKPMCNVRTMQALHYYGVMYPKCPVHIETWTLTKLVNTVVVVSVCSCLM